MNTLQRAYTRCGFGQLHYVSAGPDAKPAGPPLILLHQNPSSSVEYQKFQAEMSKDRLVVAFDTPGNGMSDGPPEAQTMAGYAAAFADGLDALGLGAPEPGGSGKVDVFGYHTGTYLAVELALSRPDLVGRLILSGIPFRPSDQRASRLTAARNPFMLEEDGAALFEFLKFMWSYVVTNRDPAVPLERAVELYAENIKPMQRHAWPYVGVWSYDAEDRLPRLSQPTLLAQPHEALLEHSLAAAALIPQAKVVEFPNLNRDVFEVGVRAFADAIRGWEA